MTDRAPEEQPAKPENPDDAQDVKQADAVEAPRDEKSVSDGISAAAANPGATAARGEQVRQARRSFAFLGETEMGDAVSGNKYEYHLHAVHEQASNGVHELKAQFVVQCCKTLIRRSPAERGPATGRIEIFRGQAGSGKAALAVGSMAGPDGGRTIFRVDPRVALTGLSLHGRPKGAGYLLEDLPAASGATMTSFDLTRLEAELDRLDSRMVITVKSETTFTDDTVNRYVREVGEPPSGREILDAHLQYLMKSSTRVTELTRRPDLAQLLDEELPPTAPPRKAAELARLIAAGAARPESLVDSVRALLRRADENEFTAWFDGLADLHLKCFAISLAIFNGLPYETVADAGLKLHRTYDVAGSATVATKAVPEAVNPFGDSRANRLQLLRARVGREVVTTIFGDVLAEVVSYQDISFPPRVLRHVWREHDRARDGLLVWLRELGGHQSLAVRVRAATAVGVLTAIAYDHMRTEVLSRWARSKRPAVREAAAIALAGPAESADHQLAEAVRNLVATWGAGTVEQRATAALAYGRLGQKALDTALPELEKLSDGEEDFDVVEAVCQSLADLVATDDREVTARVFGMLRNWSASRRQERRTTGGFAFLLIAADLVTRPAPANGMTTWPSLLWCAHQDPGLHQVLAELWTGALNSATTASLALTVLDEWAQLVEGNQLARRTFVALLRSACRTERVPIRLQRQASKWAEPESATAAPRTARELLAMLTWEGPTS